ncbi:MAG: YbaN family protein [Pseudomonadales bacterium]|nr:YbaN family protein [Pseudomonadales bacterium]MCP5183766.1 YbaN family protein [Pseudomonadales bacterium]
MAITETGKKLAFTTAGIISLGLGIIGAVLPLLPTTPFLLLAAFCFTQGSSRLHGWLMSHPRLGPPIHAWQRHRAIGRPAKWLGSLSMVLVLLFGLWFNLPAWVLGIQTLALAGVSLFLWTRPEPPTEDAG